MGYKPRLQVAVNRLITDSAPFIFVRQYIYVYLAGVSLTIKNEGRWVPDHQYISMYLAMVNHLLSIATCIDTTNHSVVIHTYILTL